MYIVKVPEKKIDISCFYTYYRFMKEKGHIFSGQRHSFWEMNVIIEGAMSLTCDDKIINLSKGQMYLIHPHEFHKFTVPPDNNAELIVLTFSMNFEPPHAVYNLSESNMMIVRMIAEEIEKNFPDGKFNSCSYVSQQVKLMTELLILRAVSYDAVPYNVNCSSGIYESAVGFMKANIFEKISISDVARHCRVSDSTIKNLFRQHTKGGVMQYFNGLKMEYAKNMLTEGYSVNEISEELRFSSAAHFSAAFKKTCGMTPLTYKKQK